MKHTKGKLKLDGGLLTFGRSVGGRRMEESDFILAQVRGWGHLQYLGEENALDIQEANAHRLVKCWNEYDDLLEALHKYGEHTQSCQDDSKEDYTKGLNHVCTCGYEKAIVNAKKE